MAYLSSPMLALKPCNKLLKVAYVDHFILNFIIQIDRAVVVVDVGDVGRFYDTRLDGFSAINTE